MNLENPATSNSHSGTSPTGRSPWRSRNVRIGATLAACSYVIVWSALLGSFARVLTGSQEVLMAVVALGSGVLIWGAVRALILQQRSLTRQESAEALEESRAFGRILMDNLPAAIWLKTLDHRYQAANLMWAQYNPVGPAWTDRSLGHLLGHTDRELYEPERAAEFEQTDDIVVATGRRWEREYDEFTGGVHIKYQVVKMPVFDIRGSVISVAGIGFDVTAMRKAEREMERGQEQMDAFLRLSPEHICILNVDRSIEFANLRVCEFLGAYPSELEGRDVVSLVTPIDRDRAVAFMERVMTDGSAGYEMIHMKNAKGEIRLFEVSGVLVATTHSPHSVVVLGRDITDRSKFDTSRD